MHRSIGSASGLLDVATSIAMCGAALALIWAVVDARRGGDGQLVNAADSDTAAVAPDQRRADVREASARISLEGTPFKGDKGARIIVLEYVDFECPYCGVFAREALTVIEERYLATGKVLFGVKHLPLERIHPHASLAAEVAECARRQGRFWEMHDAVFARSDISESAIYDAADLAGLDEARLGECLAADAKARVRENMEEAASIGVVGTPTFVFLARESDGVRLLRRERGALSSDEWPRLRNLFAAVEFLRFLEGEKHIIFLTENGLQLAGREPLWNGGISQSIAGADNAPRYDSFAALASDARVAVSTIQTDGLPLEFDEDTVNGVKVYLTRSRTFEQLFAITDTRAVAVKTGGMASAYRYADDALDRLDRATRFQYLIGYYPSNQNWDGGYRSIRVVVREPGVKLPYRQGYYARESDAAYDRRSFMTQNRILASAAADRVSRDLRVSVDVEAVPFRDGSGDVRVDLLIAPDRVMWLRDETGYHAQLTAAISPRPGPGHHHDRRPGFGAKPSISHRFDVVWSTA